MRADPQDDLPTVTTTEGLVGLSFYLSEAADALERALILRTRTRERMTL